MFEKQSETNLRIILLEDTEAIRSSMTKMLRNRGFEVFSFSNPSICPLQLEPECRCDETQTCTDIIVSDMDMPEMTGLTFIENQRRKNCKCQHVALMSGLWTEENLEHAQELDCKVFVKPFPFDDLIEWISKIQKDVKPSRKLCMWFEDSS
jgi:CheY-like chemotaxis protein